MENLEERMCERKPLVFEEIRDICYLEAKSCKCHGFIRGIELDENQKAPAQFSHDTNEISFNTQRLYDDANKVAEYFINRFKLFEKNRVIYENIVILVTIFHEVEHAYKRLKYLNGEMNNLESYLYSFCQKMVSCNRTFYMENHYYFPTEIDAELTGWEKSIQILSSLEFEEIELLCFQKHFINKIVAWYGELNDNFYKGPTEIMLSEY